MVEIKGFMKTSMLDYPSKLASVIFLPRCNFHCPYCHNVELVMNDPRLITFETKKVINFLKEKKNWIDGVVISGGEPTLHEGLVNLCKQIKKLGYDIKLDTNGTNPDMLKLLIDKKLVNYIAMDIKSSKDKYVRATAMKVNIKNIDKSVKLLLNSKIEYEFRTTVVPGIVEKEDIDKIGKWIKGAKKYYLQQFVPIKTLNENYKTKEPYVHGVLHEMLKKISKYVEFAEVRGT